MSRNNYNDSFHFYFYVLCRCELRAAVLCACVLSVVVSPFVLHTITWEAAHYLASMNHTSVQANLRSPILSPIVQKCVQMYIQCIHQRMYHITPPEYDDFYKRRAECAEGRSRCRREGQAQFQGLYSVVCVGCRGVSTISGCVCRRRFRRVSSSIPHPPRLPHLPRRLFQPITDAHLLSCDLFLTNH